MSQSGILKVADSILPPDVPLIFDADIGSGSATANTFNILGSSALSGTTPVSTTASGNTLTLEVQLAQSSNLSSVSKAGLSSFDSSNFAVDSNGFVTFIGGSGFVTSVSGTANRITSTGGTTPVIDISGSYVGQTSITTLGTITTGTWNGNTIDVAHGGTGQTALTNHSVLVGATTSAITQLTVGTNGQVIIGATAADPAFATLTSSDSSISFTTGANTLSLQVAGGTTVIKTITGNSGGAEVPTAGNFNILGTGSITVAGSANTETVQLTGLTNHAIQIGAGTATLTQLSVGSTGQVLQANSAADPTWSTATFPSVATGTGKILIADGTNWVASTPTYPNSAGTSGKILISDGTNIVSSTPTYPNAASTALKHIKSDGTNFVTTTVTYPDASVTAGKVIISDGTNYIASTPTFPNASATSGKFIQSDGTNWIASTPTIPSTAGTSGKILISDGTNFISSTPTYPNTSGTSGKVVISDGTNNVYSTPTFPNASATTRKIIVSDGTDWVASTETWAVPGTSGNVLTSDGTNWTSAAASGGNISIATTTLTSAQIKALHATPITVIAAPGSGKVISLINVTYSYNYGGTNVFTAAAAQTVKLYYGTTDVIQTVASNATLVGTASTLSSTSQIGTTSPGTADDNLAVTLYNSVATEITGNAANNNTVKVTVLYTTYTRA